MTTTIVNGNLLDTTAPVIMHQVNCCKGFGSGVAKAIRDKWPVVAEKHGLACRINERQNNPTSALLGKIQVVKVEEDKVVINLFSQDNFGYDGAKYTSYDALDTCLGKVKDYCVEHKYNRVAMPYKMSSVRGGADWDVVQAIVNANFKDADIEIEIRKFEP